MVSIQSAAANVIILCHKIYLEKAAIGIIVAFCIHNGYYDHYVAVIAIYDCDIHTVSF